MSNYDLYGWYTTDPKYANRVADITLSINPGSPVIGELYPNWTGVSWKNSTYTAPPQEEEVILNQENPQVWWIDVGPFRDRLGMDTLAIAASTHPVCLGVKEMLYDRKYIDLKDPRVSQLLDILIATDQPTASPYFPGSGPMTLIKKDLILNTPTTESERNVKGVL